MSKILIITDDPNATTGNAKVCLYTCKQLEKHGHKITSIIAWNCIGGNNKYKWKLWPIDPDKQNHRDTGVKLQMAINAEDPDIIFVHGDIWNFGYMPKIKTRAKKIGYITVDFEPLNKEWAGIFKSFDVILSPSKYGSKVIQREMNIGCETLYEGVDTSIFKPLDLEIKNNIRNKIKEQCKDAMLNIPEYLLSMLSRPIIRKNLPVALDAISSLEEYYKDKIGIVCMYDPMVGRFLESEHDMDDLHSKLLPPKMPPIS